MLGLTTLDVAALAAYFLAVGAIGLISARRVHTLGDYLMGGRRFGKTYMVMHTFSTGTQTDHAVAVVGASYELGLAGIWYQWLWLFTTPFYWLIAPVFRRMRYLTMGDFFAHRYGRSLEAFYASTCVLVLMLQMGLMLQGTARTIEGLTGGRLPMGECVIAMAVVLAVYSFAGGLIAAIRTDAFQGLLIIFFSFLPLPFVVEHVGGLAELRRQVGPQMFSLVAPREVTFFYVVMVTVNALVGVPIRPHQMALGGAGRTEMEARIGLTYGGFLKRLCTLGWAIAGLYAAALCPGLTHRELALGELTRSVLPAGLVGLALAAFLAGSMSTCDSVTVAGSGLLTQNLYRKFVAPNRSDRHYLLVGRLSGLAFLGGGVVLAFSFPTVVSMMEALWRVTGFLGIAFWGGLLWPRANCKGAWAGVLAAAGLALVLQIKGEQNLATQIALYLPTGFLALIIVSLLTAPEPRKKIEDFYATLSVPIGQEYQLEKANVAVVYSGYSEKTGDRSRLVLVDLALRRAISWSSHRVDLAGFLLAWGIALTFLLLAWAIAFVAETGLM
ncbi:MAG: sodium:solute symporter family protein [candidate division KSB1 bacterium]|nr:sodium:solute symporter family protein [candidate division KSB1 bacterium]